MNLLQTIENEIVAARTRAAVDIRPGDTVRVHARIKEGEKTRTQVFEGTVIKINKGGPCATFTVRKVSAGVGVERIFPFCSPNVQKIEVTARHKVRRAKLYYLRKLSGKAARLKPIREFRAAGAKKGRRRKRGRKKAAARA